MGIETVEQVGGAYHAHQISKVVDAPSSSAEDLQPEEHRKFAPSGCELVPSMATRYQHHDHHFSSDVTVSSREPEPAMATHHHHLHHDFSNAENSGANKISPLPPWNGRHSIAQHELSLADANGRLLICPFPPEKPPSPHTEKKKKSPLSSLKTLEINDDFDRYKLRVADIGTGSGLWARDFAWNHPDVGVVGLDLTLPDLDALKVEGELPRNLRFGTLDVTKRWDDETQDPIAARYAPYDLIHGRHILTNLKNPVASLPHLYKMLRPGTGLVEFREYWLPVQDMSVVQPTNQNRSENDPLPESMLVSLGSVCTSACKSLGLKPSFARLLPNALGSADFVDITTKDTNIPIGGWMRPDPGGGVAEVIRVRETERCMREVLRSSGPALASVMVTGPKMKEADAVRYVQTHLDELDRDDLADFGICYRMRTVWARKPDAAEYAARKNAARKNAAARHGSSLGGLALVSGPRSVTLTARRSSLPVSNGHASAASGGGASLEP